MFINRLFLSASVLFPLFLVIACDKFDEPYLDKYQNDYTRSCVNLINEKTLHYSKSLTKDGKVVEDEKSNSIVTDYLSVYLGDLWFEKVIYLQVCCEESGEYGFCSQRVVFYDNKGRVVPDGVIDTPNSAIVIPEGARYARVQFSNKGTKYYAAITNRSILNTYSKFNDSLFYKSKIDVFGSVENSDGAISLLLKTGFDYLGRFGKKIGYGSYHTAFNTDCVMDYSYDDYYEGKKYEIDCSSFVLLSLLGIPYNGSRYELGSQSENIPDSSAFKFDQFAEYNYYMIACPWESGANTGRMYANKIAKYFYDRGLLYKVSPDLSNIRTGDLLFWGSGYEKSDFFMGIGHVAICSDSWPESDGGRGIKIMEALSEKKGEYSEELIFGARPQLPYVSNNRKNLVKGFEPIQQIISLKKGSQQFLTTISLSEDLINREIYSLFIECGNLSGISIICKVNNGGTIMGGNSDKEVYTSNIVEKHFGFYLDEMGKDKKNIYLYAYAREDVNSEVTIKNVEVIPGFHSFNY